MIDVTRSFRLAGVAAVSLLALQGCSTVKSALGMEKQPPDEFAIATKAPLVVPPDFTLRPPRPDARGPKEDVPAEQAQRTIFGKAPSPVASGDQSPGELALLSAAGADRADPAIRDTLAQDVAARSDDDGRTSFGEWLRFWESGDGANEAIDPAEEAARVRQSQVDEGAEPTAATGEEPAKSAEGDGEGETDKKPGLLSRLWPF